MDMNTLLAVVAALLVVMLALRVYRGGRTRQSVAALISEGAHVIDVRTPEEYSAGHYEGARNIPLSELSRRVNEIGARDDAVVLYCRTGSRSAMAANELRSAGFTSVVNAGGLSRMPRRASP